MKKTNSSRGSALLSALFIMTLVAIAATAMSARLQYDIYRTRLLINKNRSSLASEAVYFWSMHQLKQKKLKFFLSAGGKNLSLYPESYKNIYPEYTINGHLDDMQAKLNLNGLNEKETFSIALEMFQQLFPKMQAKQRQEILLNIKDWISAYRPEKGMDELQSWYLKQKPAYQPARQPMSSLSELRLVKGVSAKIYRKLEPYVTVLPDATPINIRTAPDILLNSMSPVLDKKILEKIKALRKESDEKKLLKFLKKTKLPEKSICLQSLYFKSEASVLHQNNQYRQSIVLKRTKGKDKKINVQLVRVGGS